MTITIGTQSLNGRPYEIDPARHVSIIGGSGVGKSSLLENLFVEFLQAGESNGGLFVDPHGDAADRLVSLIPRKRRMRDLIFIDPDAGFVPPMNPLYFSEPEQLELAKETCLTLLKALAGSDSAWGNETPHNIRNGLDAICDLERKPTLVHLFRFLVDEEYRDGLLDKSDNAFSRLFKDAFKKLREQDRQAKFAPAVNKLSKLMRSNILALIGAPDSLDLLDIMNTGKIVICRFSKGRLGEETAQILYSLVISLFSIAALKREKQKKRPPFMIVADEAHNGAHGGRFGTLLAEARKYSISLVTALQGSYQAPFMHDILSNSTTQIVFNASGEDAELMAKNWNDPNVTAQHISELSRYEFYARTFENDQPIVRHVKALPQLRPRLANPSRVVDYSFRRWGRDKKETNLKINQFLSVGSPKPKR